jgi:hypothetical protein
MRPPAVLSGIERIVASPGLGIQGQAIEVLPRTAATRARKFRGHKGPRKDKDEGDDLAGLDRRYGVAVSARGSSFAIALALTFIEQNLGPHIEQNAAVL